MKFAKLSSLKGDAGSDGGGAVVREATCEGDDDEAVADAIGGAALRAAVGEGERRANG